MSLNDCKIIDLPKVSDPRGNLTFIESFKQIKFDIKRAYYLYDVPGGSERGGHAHKKLKQLIIALSGSFDIILKDANTEIKYHLNSPSKGLYMSYDLEKPKKIFHRALVCLVLASSFYSEDDYYRDFDFYVKDLNFKMKIPFLNVKSSYLRASK